MFYKVSKMTKHICTLLGCLQIVFGRIVLQKDTERDMLMFTWIVRSYHIL